MTEIMRHGFASTAAITNKSILMVSGETCHWGKDECNWQPKKRSHVSAWVRDGSKMLQKWVPEHSQIPHGFPRRWWIWFLGRGSALLLVSHSLFYWYFQKQLRTLCDFQWDFKLSSLPHYRDLSPAKNSSYCRKWSPVSLFLTCMYYKCV